MQEQINALSSRIATLEQAIENVRAGVYTRVADLETELDIERSAYGRTIEKAKGRISDLESELRHTRDDLYTAQDRIRGLERDVETARRGF